MCYAPNFSIYCGGDEPSWFKTYPGLDTVVFIVLPMIYAIFCTLFLHKHTLIATAYRSRYVFHRRTDDG
jgi:hypothetical protein